MKYRVRNVLLKEKLKEIANRKTKYGEVTELAAMFGYDRQNLIQTIFNLRHGIVKYEVRQRRKTKKPIRPKIPIGLTKRTVGNIGFFAKNKSNPDFCNALATLREREKMVLMERYLNLRTFASIANEMNISRERVRQIETKGLRKLCHPARGKYTIGDPCL